MLGTLDPVLEHVVEREALKTALARIPERERRILLPRFFGGISQMHISRLIAKSLDWLRIELTADD